MLTRYLFPHRYKRLGWVLAAISLVLGVLEMHEVIKLPPLLAWLPSPIGEPDWLESLHRPARANHDLYAVVFIIGALLAACSREKYEDEYIAQIRLESLMWALYAYSALLALAFLLVSGTPFFTVMKYAMFSPLLLFLVRFQVALYSSSAAADYAK